MNIRVKTLPSSRRITQLSAFFSILLLAVLFNFVDFSHFADLPGRIEPFFMVLCVFFELSHSFFAAWRLRLLDHQERPPGFDEYLYITAWRGLYLIILPVRLGEVFYVVILRRCLGMEWGAALANNIYQRIFDATVLAAIFLISWALLFEVIDTKPLWLAGISLFILLLSAMLLFFDRLLGGAVHLLTMLCERYPKRRLLVMLLSHLDASVKWSRLMVHKSRPISMLMTSIGMWMGAGLLVWAAFRGVGEMITPGQGLFLVSGISFISLIPLQTIGGFGVIDVGLAGLLVMLGWNLETASAVAIITRLQLLASQLTGQGLLIFATTLSRRFKASVQRP